MRSGGGVPSCDAVGETGSGAAKILRCVLGCSVCAVFVSSSFVSSDEAYAMERRGLEQLGGTHGE